VSRRNLDRVLYFAQYVITSVDDEARQRALKRLDDELAEAELRLEERFAGRSWRRHFVDAHDLAWRELEQQLAVAQRDV
jgi:hypothetical protein